MELESIHQMHVLALITRCSMKNISFQINFIAVSALITFMQIPVIKFYYLNEYRIQAYDVGKYEDIKGIY